MKNFDCFVLVQLCWLFNVDNWMKRDECEWLRKKSDSHSHTFQKSTLNEKREMMLYVSNIKHHQKWLKTIHRIFCPQNPVCIQSESQLNIIEWKTALYVIEMNDLPQHPTKHKMTNVKFDSSASANALFPLSPISISIKHNNVKNNQTHSIMNVLVYPIEWVLN